jgi:hypothetical protein
VPSLTPDYFFSTNPSAPSTPNFRFLAAKLLPSVQAPLLPKKYNTSFVARFKGSLFKAAYNFIFVF